MTSSTQRTCEPDRSTKEGAHQGDCRLQDHIGGSGASNRGSPTRGSAGDGESPPLERKGDRANQGGGKEKN
jgi:hypothetical protein